MMDVVFTDIAICDGSGNAIYRSDVGVSSGRLLIGDLKRAGAQAFVPAEPTWVIVPGFIDVHSHADLNLLGHPRALNLLCQGVTTFVGGNCGFSPAPLGDHWPTYNWEYDIWHDAFDYKYEHPPLMPLGMASERLFARRGWQPSWKSFSEYLGHADELSIAVNYVPLVGHNAIRLAVLGDLVEADVHQVEQMKVLVEEAMDSGAFGMSSGLDYYPGNHANAHEIRELVACVAHHDAIYATHWRGSSMSRSAELGRLGRVGGIREALDVGRKTGSRVLLSHLYSGYDVHPTPPEILSQAAARATIADIERFRNDGVDVAFDVIPSTDGGLLESPYLASFLKPWLVEAGSPERFAELLRARDRRDEIMDVLEAGDRGGFHPATRPDWASKILVLSEEDMTLEQLALEKQTSPLEAMFDLIAGSPRVKACVRGSVPSAGVQVFLDHEIAMVGTDGSSFAADFVIEDLPGYSPHVNNFKSFPRLFSRFSRDTLEETVHQVTMRPAEWFGLKDRGVIRDGAIADVAVLDMDAYTNHDEKRSLAAGIQYLLVNGTAVIWESCLQESMPGKVLRRSV